MLGGTVDSRRSFATGILSWGVFCNAFFVILLSLPPLLSSF